ncbi:polysaccharide deacetylase family protein [Paenibacillus chungangensis]|uniref:Polysaccharide deacetylase family protein n=1 Tax=Paenibacillus chungangensis TaxID=696535 RepID=A0ABW3HPM6_9BACL
MKNWKRWTCLLCVIGAGSSFITGFTDRPTVHNRSYYETRGEIVWEVPMEEKLIALTFDDGPHEKETQLILDLLKQYDAKSTFFVVGNRLDRYADIVRREVEEGHEVANHTYNHLLFNRNVSSARILKEIADSEAKIKWVTGQECKWFRPPGGNYSERVVQIAKQAGYTIVLWSWHQDTKDWTSPGVQAIANKVLKNARNGDIVLLHDNIQGSMQTVKALQIILPELKKRGYRMVTISELIQHKPAQPLQSAPHSEF